MWRLCVAEWLSPAAPLPLCFIGGAADEKRESALSLRGPAPHTHSKACWEPVAMTVSADRERAMERKTCGAAKWQFSAGKEDLNHMFHSHWGQREYFGTFWQFFCTVPQNRPAVTCNWKSYFVFWLNIRILLLIFEVSGALSAHILLQWLKVLSDLLMRDLKKRCVCVTPDFSWTRHPVVLVICDFLLLFVSFSSFFSSVIPFLPLLLHLLSLSVRGQSSQQFSQLLSTSSSLPFSCYPSGF